MNLNLPVYEPPVQPKQTQYINIQVRYIVFHRTSGLVKYFESMRPGGPMTMWSNYDPFQNAFIDVPVDPITAMTQLSLTPHDMGFTEAEQALLNLLKR